LSLAAVVLVGVLLPACLARFEVGGGDTGSETAASTETSSGGESGGESEAGDGGECSCDATLEICDDGECVCRFGFSLCTGECVDLQSDPMHCGDCDEACTVGACDEGNCDPDGCQESTDCGGACVDIEHSPLHCGGCDQACAGDELCIEGECVGYQSSDCRSDLDCGAGVCCSVEEQGKLCVDGDLCP
jgi:hypothetical protein